MLATFCFDFHHAFKPALLMLTLRPSLVDQ